MGLIVLSLRSSPPLQFARLPLQIGRGVLPLLASLFMFVSLKYMPLAEATSIMFISPLLITILSIFALREPVSGPHWAAVVLGFIGVGIVLRPGTGTGHWAALLLLFAAAQSG
jgi:drug/metabolite transporter (DMT)-like permease